MNNCYDTSSPLIEYNNDEEYRDVLRTIFKMDCDSRRKEIHDTYGDLDKESFDELLYDEARMMLVMDQLYDMTENHPQFQELYRLAAAKMLSEDLSIGQAVLCCYDYLYLFHPCMCVFIDRPSEFNETCPYFIQLRDKLSNK
jgi:hypothetical protein